MSSASKDLTQGPVPKTLIQLGLPLLVGILSAVGFNLIDTFFIGQLGKKELAAISFTFPVIMVVYSLVQGISLGATALISQSIGRHDRNKAARETTDGLFLAVLIALICSITGYFTIDPLFTALGAKPEILPLIREYMEVWYLTVLLLIAPFIGNSALTATGDTRTPSYIMLLSIGLNTILDPLLIFGWGFVPELGLQGAALATAIARGITLFLSIYILRVREGLLTFTIPSRTVIIGCWRAILYVGIPNGLSRMAVPVATGIVTSILASQSLEAVAAYGVGTKVEFLGMSIFFALSASIAPFVGQNLGQNRWDRIQKSIQISISFALVWGTIMAIAFYFLAKTLASPFSDDPTVIEYGALYLTIIPISFGFQGIYQVINATLNTLRKPITAFTISVTYTFLLYVPLAWAGSKLYGIPGIFGGLVISNVLSAFISYFFYRRIIKAMTQDT